LIEELAITRLVVEFIEHSAGVFFCDEIVGVLRGVIIHSAILEL
jgi:hypothetical protein